MVSDLKKYLKSNIRNIPGWHTKRKIVVFESDDWGNQRMPSVHSLNSLESKGLKLKHLKYASIDTLEKRSDIESLADMLNSFSHLNYKPIFTMNMIMANPDFEKIKNDNFDSFSILDIKASYEKYNGDSIIDVWEKAISANLFDPQYHSREHLNSNLWIKDLKNGMKSTRIAFDHDFYGQIEGTSSILQSNYLMSYYVENMNEVEDLKLNISDGIGLFNKYFNKKPQSFVACNYVWPTEIESFLSECGIEFIQAQWGQTCPHPSELGRKKTRYLYTGKRNVHNQVYTIRNVQFEPFLDQNKNWVDSAMKQIETAFFWNKPAIISTHRANYVDGLVNGNRDKSLLKLKQLILKLTEKYPEVEFVSSVELGQLITKKQ